MPGQVETNYGPTHGMQLKKNLYWVMALVQMLRVISIFSFAIKETRVHNAYLKIWLELGLVGLLITIFLFLNYFYILKKQYNHSKYLNDNLLSSVLFAAYVTMIATSVVAFFGWSAYLDKNLWLSFAIALSTNKLFSNNKHLLPS